MPKLAFLFPLNLYPDSPPTLSFACGISQNIVKAEQSSTGLRATPDVKMALSYVTMNVHLQSRRTGNAAVFMNKDLLATRHLYIHSPTHFTGIDSSSVENLQSLFLLWHMQNHRQDE